jgi:hypothetical protein
MRGARFTVLFGTLSLCFACSISRAKDDKAVPAASAAPQDDKAHTIVIASDVNHATVHQFVKGHGRPATREELLELHRVWIDDEILFREGQKLPGDNTDREKVVTRALHDIDQKLGAAPVTEVDLRRWFEAHRDQYEQPMRFDFEDAPLGTAGTEAAARALATTLNATTPPTVPGDVRAFQKRPEANLAQSYGAEVAKSLSAAAPGKWQAVHARDGWRVMRLLSSYPATHAVFETQREAVRKDLVASTLVERRAAAVRALWSQYKIELEEPLDCLADK